MKKKTVGKLGIAIAIFEHPAVQKAGKKLATAVPVGDIIATEIDWQIFLCSPFGLPVHIGRSHNLHCRRPSAALAQFAEIASDLEK
jgi:hypothetical protein